MDDPRAHLAFDPTEGTVIRTPDGEGYGYWVGGHKVWFDAESGEFALFYRQRVPLELGRGGYCRVARSDDGITFEDAWEATKDELCTTSIEVGHCVRDPEGEWRLYLSYEYAVDGRWRIDVVRGDDPSRLDTQGRRTVLSPVDFGVDWIKDPWIYRNDDGYSLLAAVPGRNPGSPFDDVVPARALDATVLAESDDGIYFPSIEYIFEADASDTWHGRRARLNGAIDTDDGVIGFYDGGRTFYDNYEEWSGLAVGPDLRNLTRVGTESGPWVTSPHGCVRYLHPVPVGDRLYCYYEYTREDGSHDLRVSVIDR